MAARVTKENYEAMKGFCIWFWEQQSSEWDKIGLSPDDRPDRVLNSFEQKSKAIAREGVRQSIGDIIEQTQGLSPGQIAAADAALAADGLPTLSQVRIEFWGKIAGIMKRQNVRSESEYYALRNVVESMSEGEQVKAWALLGDFEMRQAGQ